METSLILADAAVEEAVDPTGERDGGICYITVQLYGFVLRQGTAGSTL